MKKFFILCSLHFFGICSLSFARPSELLMAPLPNDDVHVLLDSSAELVSNLKSLDEMSLTSFTLPQQPWSDSYWPTFKGIIGIRYADPAFPNAKDWAVNYAYISENTAASWVHSGDQRLINQLSPAEKYDLLVGDSNWTLTNYSWNQGAKIYAQSNHVPEWMGICDGWAAASHMQMPIVHHSIQATSVEGVPITFYPSDIKGLQSMLWAKSPPKSRFIGSRCEKNPTRNSSGRITNPECYDNNPATVHLALTNQLGLQKRSINMSATNNVEVWNYPIFSYRYSYFNPQSHQPSRDYRQAILPIENYSLDRFKSDRAAGTKYIIGIAMDVSYVNEVNPSRGAQTDIPIKVAHYFYDLELDSNLNILGGEWQTNKHPDFLWTFDAKAIAISVGDLSIRASDWNVPGPVPSSWVTAAQRSSARGSPLLAVIKGLLAISGTGAEAPTSTDH